MKFTGRAMVDRLSRHLFTLFLACLSWLSVEAQETERGNWFIYVGSQPIGKGWTVWNEAQYRNYNLAGDLEQLLFRTGLGKNLTENNNNLLLGYAYILSEPYIAGTSAKRSFSEHRTFLQFITRQSFGRVFLQHRYRLEQRFLEDGFRSRFRYFLGVNLLLNKSKMEKGAVYLSAYDEIFVHVDKPVFDRNRVYGAVGYVLRKDLRLELGYMSQLLEQRRRPQWQIAIFNNLSFGKR